MLSKYIYIYEYTHNIILKDTMHFLRLYNCILNVYGETFDTFHKLPDLFVTERRITATAKTITNENKG